MSLAKIFTSSSANSARTLWHEVPFPCDYTVTEHPESGKASHLRFLIPSQSIQRGQARAEIKDHSKNLVVCKVPYQDTKLGKEKLNWHLRSWERDLSLAGLMARNLKDPHTNQWTLFNAVIPKEKTAMSPTMMYGHSKGPSGEKHPQLLKYLEEPEKSKFEKEE